jgi:hypothetical protein
VKSNGSRYVVVVFVVLFGYFGYQWWLNPSRAVKRRLGEIAAALSIPPNEGDISRVARLGELRRYLADDVHVRAGRAAEITSRDMAVAAAAAWRPPPGGGNVRFADVQVFIESADAAHAYLSVELASTDRESGQTIIDARDASVDLARRGGEWVVTKVESKEPTPVPPSPR